MNLDIGNNWLDCWLDQVDNPLINHNSKYLTFGWFISKQLPFLRNSVKFCDCSRSAKIKLPGLSPPVDPPDVVSLMIVVRLHHRNYRTTV